MAAAAERCAAVAAAARRQPSPRRDARALSTRHALPPPSPSHERRQTGSGKTYTTGFEVRDVGASSGGSFGVVQMATRDLLAALSPPVEGGDGASDGGPNAAAPLSLPPGVSLSATFIEIYNEKPRDLLRVDGAAEPQRGFQVIKDAFHNYYVDGAASMPIASVADLNGALLRGAARRAVASTRMNEHSSRSHAVFTLQLERLVVPPAAAAAAAAAASTATATAEGGAAPPPAPAPLRQVSLLRFVDLAGSERVGQTGATGQRLKEGTNINRSLATLGKCIAALAAKQAHVPFRESL